MVDNVARKITLIVLLLATSAGLLLLKDRPFELGLDLQGGTRLVYSVPLEEAYERGELDRREDPALVIEQMIEIVRNRVDPQGTLEAVIRRGGENRIVIELPGSLGAPGAAAAAELAEPLEPEEGGRLVLAEAEAFPESGVVSIGGERIRYAAKEGDALVGLERAVGGVLGRHDAGARVELEQDDAFRAAIESLGELSFQIVAEQGLFAELDTDFTTEQEKLRAWAEENPGAPLTAFNRLSPEEGGPHPRIEWYPFAPQDERMEGQSALERATPVFRPESEDARFRGSDLAEVYYTQDNLGYPAVGFEFKPARRGDFADFTEESLNRRMAIILNEEIASAPNIDERLPGRGIIRGRFTQDEVTDLITVLRSGSLKIRPQLESDERVGATLGEQYVRLGFYSGIAALSVVLVFMALYYRRLGIFASLSLLASFLMLMGGLAFLDATLTLPGIAGILLTVGMAVDANILIFDRIREEMDKGRNVKQAAKNGFDLARSAILDANITTFLTAIILYQVGTGPVRGFAVTLMVGIVSSVFAALVVTRVLVHFALVRGVRTFRMGTWMVSAAYDFLGKAKVAMAGSLVVILAGVGWFFVLPEGEKLGIDFLGGVETKLRMAEAVEVDVVRQRLREIPGVVGESADVKAVLASEQEDGRYTMFRTTVKTAGLGSDTEVRSLLREALHGLLLEEPVQVELAEEEGAASVDLALHFAEPHPREDIAEALSAAGLREPEVEAVPEEPGTYRVAALATLGSDPTELTARVQNLFRERADPLGRAYQLATPLPDYKAVGPQVVGELRDKALLAIGISLFVTVLYIRVRFAEYSYGFAAVGAVAHDVLITLAALTLANQLGFVNGEINLPMIAAFLTIIGYSLNDTIVIFDRVRENLPRMKRPLREIVNESINQTMSRTILTSFTTFLAVAILYGFNFGTGNVLESFAFAMMVGVITGTYSTVFIANPLFIWFEERAAARRERVAQPRPAEA